VRSGPPPLWPIVSLRYAGENVLGRLMRACGMTSTEKGVVMGQGRGGDKCHATVGRRYGRLQEHSRRKDGLGQRSVM
jgi:hypothetical protein